MCCVPDTERCFCARVCACVCVDVRVSVFSPSLSLIIELILSSLLGRYTAASHSFLSFSLPPHLSILPLYLHLSLPFHPDPSVHSLPLSVSAPSLPPALLAHFLRKSLLFFDPPSTSLASLSFTPAPPPPPPTPPALHHPSPSASLYPPEVRGRSFLSTVRLKPAAASPVGKWGGGVF